MGIISKIKRNISEYKKAQRNPTILIGESYPLSQVKKEFFKIHNKLTFVERLAEIPFSDFIIKIEQEGFYLSDIIMHNLEKRYKVIGKVLFGEGDSVKLKWTEMNDELVGVLKSPYTKREIKNKINLP